MKVIDKIHFLIASICLLYTTGISSQNMTTSPYSMFGIGELTDGHGHHPYIRMSTGTQQLR